MTEEKDDGQIVLILDEPDGPLTFDDYQLHAKSTAIYPRPADGTFPAYPALGLAGEAGEVCEKVKKAIRDDGGTITEERRQDLKLEIGDCLWYISNLCSELDLTFSEVAEGNLDKLFDRKRRGKLRGDGDNR